MSTKHHRASQRLWLGASGSFGQVGEVLFQARVSQDSFPIRTLVDVFKVLEQPFRLETSQIGESVHSMPEELGDESPGFFLVQTQIGQGHVQCDDLPSGATLNRH